MCGLLTLKQLNSISEITAVNPDTGRDTEMYPIEFNYIKSYNWVKVVSGRRNTPKVATIINPTTMKVNESVVSDNVKFTSYRVLDG